MNHTGEASHFQVTNLNPAHLGQKKTNLSYLTILNGHCEMNLTGLRFRSHITSSPQCFPLTSRPSTASKTYKDQEGSFPFSFPLSLGNELSILAGQHMWETIQMLSKRLTVQPLSLYKPWKLWMTSASYLLKRWPELQGSSLRHGATLKQLITWVAADGRHDMQLCTLLHSPVRSQEWTKLLNSWFYN